MGPKCLAFCLKSHFVSQLFDYQNNFPLIFCQTTNRIIKIVAALKKI